MGGVLTATPTRFLRHVNLVRHRRCRGSDCPRFFFSSRRRHTRYIGDWSSDVCSSDLPSARTVVHHVLLYTDTTKGGRAMDGQDGMPGFPGFGSVLTLQANDPTNAVSGGLEIGRASCRERGENPSGAGALNKDTEHYAS